MPITKHAATNIPCTEEDAIGYFVNGFAEQVNDVTYLDNGIEGTSFHESARKIIEKECLEYLRRQTVDRLKVAFDNYKECHGITDADDSDACDFYYWMGATFGWIRCGMEWMARGGCGEYKFIFGEDEFDDLIEETADECVLRLSRRGKTVYITIEEH